MSVVFILKTMYSNCLPFFVVKGFRGELRLKHVGKGILFRMKNLGVTLILNAAYISWKVITFQYNYGQNFTIQDPPSFPFVQQRGLISHQ